MKQAKLVEITPMIAEAMLATSNGNRPMKAAKLKAYRRDMENGKWSMNGESIIIDVNGSLVDGHHRLTACVQSGATIMSVVVTGAPIDAQKTIDMGASRTAGDALSFFGYKNSNNVNAIVRVLLSLENGRARSANPSTQEVFAFVEANPEIHAAATFASRQGRVMHKVNSLLGAMYFLEAKHGDVSRVAQFAEVLASGIPAYQGCAAHALRERILRDEIAKTKVSIAERQLLILSAWEKFKVFAPVKTLKSKASFSLVSARGA